MVVTSRKTICCKFCCCCCNFSCCGCKCCVPLSESEDENQQKTPIAIQSPADTIYEDVSDLPDIYEDVPDLPDVYEHVPDVHDDDQKIK